MRDQEGTLVSGATSTSQASLVWLIATVGDRTLTHGSLVFRIFSHSSKPVNDVAEEIVMARLLYNLGPERTKATWCAWRSWRGAREQSVRF